MNSHLALLYQGTTCSHAGSKSASTSELLSGHAFTACSPAAFYQGTLQPTARTGAASRHNEKSRSLQAAEQILMKRKRASAPELSCHGTPSQTAQTPRRFEKAQLQLCYQDSRTNPALAAERRLLFEIAIFRKFFSANPASPPNPTKPRPSPGQVHPTARSKLPSCRIVQRILALFRPAVLHLDPIWNAKPPPVLATLRPWRMAVLHHRHDRRNHILQAVEPNSAKENGP
jgi:hypothetical protein